MREEVGDAHPMKQGAGQGWGFSEGATVLGVGGSVK